MRRQDILEGAPGPRDYVKLAAIQSDWRVLDIGPGRYPLRRANVFVDHDQEMLNGLPEDSERILANIESGLPQIADKAFDFVWCSHVLEHVSDPQACATTLSRIGKSGTIVMPSAIKESIFNFEESDHKWLVLPHPSGMSPIFVRHNAAYIAQIKDIEVQKIMCRLFRTGTHENTMAEQHAREWFRLNEPSLDVVWHWVGKLTLTVIG